MSDELMNRARELLAEVEAQRKRGDEVIAVLRCLRDVCTTPGETKADFVERIKAVLGADPDARVESLYAAEARLRELASAEPVAWVDGENFVWPKGKRRPSNCDALIRRPSMEGGK